MANSQLGQKVILHGSHDANWLFDLSCHNILAALAFVIAVAHANRNYE